MNPTPSRQETFFCRTNDCFNSLPFNRRTLMNRMKTLAAVSVLTLLAGSTQAATIYSEDFEGAVFNQGGNTFNTANGWASTAFTTAGLVNELSSIYASHLTSLGNAFGVNFEGNTLTADTGINFAANTQYTFSFDHFRRSGGSPAGDAVRAQIQTAAGVVLATEDFAAVTANASATDIENRIVTYDTTGSVGVVGEEIRLVFIDSNGGTSSNQAGIDNIVLSAVPEPGSLALMGLGALCVLRRRRG